MKLQGTRVIIKEIKEEKKKVLIITPDEEVKPFITGEVVAIGTDVKKVKVGQTVLVNRQMSGLVQWGEEFLPLLLEEEIIAIK